MPPYACLSVSQPAFDPKNADLFSFLQIVAVMTWVFTPTATPFYHSFGPAFRRQALSWLVLATVLSSSAFTLRSPFDAQHPRRIFLEQVSLAVLSSVLNCHHASMSVKTMARLCDLAIPLLLIDMQTYRSTTRLQTNGRSTQLRWTQHLESSRYLMAFTTSREEI